MNQLNHFKTTDLLMCSVLIYFNHNVREIDKSESRRCVFVIEKKETTEKIIAEFHNRKLLVEPSELFNIQKNLKGRIYN